MTNVLSFPLTSTYGAEDEPRIQQVLVDLCVDNGNILPGMVVGGLAIRHWLKRAGLPLPERPFNDIDLMMYGPSSLSPNVLRKFWVHHYHLKAEGVDFRFVLVHKTTGIKVDIFHWKETGDNGYRIPFAPPRDGAMSNLPYTAQVQSASAQFAVTVYDLHTMGARGPIDPKQLADAHALFPLIGASQAHDAWQHLWHNQLPIGLLSALGAAEKHAGDPSVFSEKPWQSQNLDYRCGKCTVSVKWPLASNAVIRKALGYIEIDGPDISGKPDSTRS